MTTAPTGKQQQNQWLYNADGEELRVWIDGEILPASQAQLSIFDHGALYGDGVFEGIRAYGGRIFQCASHIERLFHSAECIRLEIPYSRGEIEQLMRDTLKANNLEDAYIRLVVTRGPGGLGLNPFLCEHACTYCITGALRLYPDDFYRKGMPIIVAKRLRIPIECLDPRIKSLNYLNNILAKIEAIDAGVLEAVMLNTDGFVAECTGDNIFVVRDGAIATPPGEAGILEGVTRAFVMSMCKELNIPCQERMLKLDDLRGADEVFLTGTAAEIIAVSQIDGDPVGKGEEGPITCTLREQFHAIIKACAPEG